MAGACISMLPIPRARLVGIVVAGATALTVAPFLFAVLGQPSITLIQIAALRLIAIHDPPAVRGSMAPAFLVGFAIAFYPLALGWGPFDPYGIGYQGHLVLPIVILFGLLLWYRREHLLLFMISLDLLAYSFGLYSNLWDALFDPLLVASAAIALLTNAARRARSGLHAE